MITIKLKNAGLLENAEFDIGGLTVMAGLNNTGKTFISKTIFSLIKTLKDSEQYLQDSQEDKIQSLISRVRTFLFNSDNFHFYEDLWEKVEEDRSGIKRIFTYDESQRGLSKNNYHYLLKRHYLLKQHYLKIIENLKGICLIASKVKLLPLQEQKKRFSQLSIDIEAFEKDLKEDASVDSLDSYRKCFDNFIITNFKKQFNNLFSTEASIIEITDENKEEILSFSVKKNKIIDIKSNQDLGFPIKEINFLFSPIVLHFFKFVSLTTTRRYLGLSSPGASYKKEYEISKNVITRFNL